MLSRFNALTRRKRRLLALLCGLALGAAVVASWQGVRAMRLRDFAAEYGRAHASGDLTRLAALFHWEGVPDAERARLKLTLAGELELPIRSLRLEHTDKTDARPRESRQGRRIPNLDPVCRLTVEHGGGEGAGISDWLIGHGPDGYRIIVWRPETPPP